MTGYPSVRRAVPQHGRPFYSNPLSPVTKQSFWVTMPTNSFCIQSVSTGGHSAWTFITRRHCWPSGGEGGGIAAHSRGRGQSDSSRLNTECKQRARQIERERKNAIFPTTWKEICLYIYTSHPSPDRMWKRRLKIDVSSPEAGCWGV